MELINDNRLTPDLYRVRNYNMQEFYINNYTSDGNLLFTLLPPSRELYAELIDNKWYWVSGCKVCTGESGTTYILCDKHDVCVDCGVHRSELTGTPWGVSNGRWRCQPCQTTLDNIRRAEALEKTNTEEYCKYDYIDQDTVLCPHCGTDQGTGDVRGDFSDTCDVCGGEFKVTVEYTVTYSTEVIGTRITE